MYPNAFIQNNVGYQQLAAIQSLVRPGDYLISSGQSIPNYVGLRPYFFPDLGGGTIEGRLLEFRETSLEPLGLSLESRLAEGRRVFFTTDVQDPAIHQRIEAAYGLKNGEMARFINRFDLQPIQLNLPGLTIVEAKRTTPAARS
jgi:hypothetical protein